MPVSRSGVMLGVTMVPNGVSIGRPPANGLPPSFPCVTGRAIGQCRQVSAVFDLLEFLLVGFRADAHLRSQTAWPRAPRQNQASEVPMP